MFLATSPSPSQSSSYRSSNADSVLERSEHGSRSQALPHYRWSALLGLGRALVSDGHDSLSQCSALHYERMFDIVRPVHFEVDVEIQHPLDEQAKRFLTDVQRSANRVLRFRGNDRRIIVTVEAHAYDREGAVSAAIREVAHIYPLVKFQPTGEPRPT